MIRGASPRVASCVIGTSLACALAAPGAPAYPIDAGEETGIARLEGYRLAQEGKVAGIALPSGARLPAAGIQLRLLQRANLELPEPDPGLGRQLLALLGAEAPRYGLAVLDLSDPERPRYAEHRGTALFNPGSVGKLAVALGVLQALADAHPDDLAARRRVLRETRVTTDAFAGSDSHVVPLFEPGEPRIRVRPLRVGDEANLWTYLDWMLSASSNAAAGMVQKELLLLRHFGAAYPVDPDRASAFLAGTPRTELGALLVEAMKSPLARNGLDPEALRQGGFFSGEGKRRAPGTSSVASARELLRFLLRVEQGHLVDASSSLELKRLLYTTQRRIRYASSPALEAAAVYFKSGSLYRCQPEPDFQCLKYHGNVENVMNSVAIVESPAGEPRLHYFVALTSNVLRKNSAVAHQTLATRIHRLLEAAHAAPATPPVPPRPDSVAESGR